MEKPDRKWQPDALIRRDGGGWFDGRTLRTYDRNGTLIEERQLTPGTRIEEFLGAVIRQTPPKPLDAP